MTVNLKKVTENLAAYPQSDAITGKILSYREGHLSFAELLKDLSEHDYNAPSHDVGSMPEAEETDHHEVGTTGELRQARALGLLTGAEYEAIVSGGLRAHGA
jgi:hypothetical protein